MREPQAEPEGYAGNSLYRNRDKLQYTSDCSVSQGEIGDLMKRGSPRVRCNQQKWIWVYLNAQTHADIVVHTCRCTIFNIRYVWWRSNLGAADKLTEGGWGSESCTPFICHWQTFSRMTRIVTPHALSIFRVRTICILMFRINCVWFGGDSNERAGSWSFTIFTIHSTLDNRHAMVI